MVERAASEGVEGGKGGLRVEVEGDEGFVGWGFGVGKGGCGSRSRVTRGLWEEVEGGKGRLWVGN